MSNNVNNWTKAGAIGSCTSAAIALLTLILRFTTATPIDLLNIVLYLSIIFFCVF